jgi:Ti-type conjugative transfer relaxase TraA
MAIYHFSSKIISRSAGRSAVAAAAYRSASCLLDERIGRSHDFTAKAGVVHSEIMLPAGAPETFSNRSVLWNAVEAGEKRKDSQLSRDIEISLPAEMSQAEAIALARDFVREQFVDRGMIADLNVHWGKTARGEDQPHAHVMLTMRSVDESGFGPKVLDWNRKDLLVGWRERWAEMANERLNALGHDVRIDHRSYADQGIDLVPQNKIGPAGARRQDRGEEAERAAEHEDIARHNGERIALQPQIALDALTRQHSSFTRQDMARFVFRHTADAEQFASVMARVEISSELVRLGTDGRGQARFSTKTMLHTEHAMEAAALALNERKTHRVAVERRTDGAGSLGDEQKLALAHVTRSRDLAVVVGYAGTGKSTMLGVARQAWEAEGYRVRGAALSGIAAEGLESGAGISSRTVHGLLHAWDQGRETLTAQDVLVVDEAGMIGSRQMERLLGAAQRAGAKVVLVGDPEQLQAIEAGAAFRRIAEQVGAVEITEVRRQREGWQQQATRELATGRTEAALGRYEAAGMVESHVTLDAAREALVAGWDASRRAEPEASQIMLAYRRDDVRDLNQRARAVRREAGELGEDRVLATERGEKGFAVGDRVYFLRNDRGLGVKNGTLGTLIGIDAAGEQLTVQVVGAGSTGRTVTFGLGDYGHIDHGYAATMHKSQGVTVDRAHVLASSVMDRHAAYVALTRHRDVVVLHWSADEFGSREKLVETLGLARLKDTSLDYAPTAPAKAYAEHRELKVDGSILLAKEIAAGTARVRERFIERRENERQGKELVARWDWALGRFEAALPGMDREVIAFHDARRDLFDIGYQLEEKPGLQAFLQERGTRFGLDKRPELRDVVHSRDPAQAVATMAHGMMADTKRELDRKAEIAARERALALAVAQERAKALAAEQAKEKAQEAAYRRSPGMGM